MSFLTRSFLFALVGSAVTLGSAGTTHLKSHHKGLPKLSPDLSERSTTALKSHHKGLPLINPDFNERSTIAARADANATSLLDVFQVYDPVTVPANGSYGACNGETILLMDRKFGYSYGEPYVGKGSLILCSSKVSDSCH